MQEKRQVSVKATRARIQAAITQLHEATVEYANTPEHYKYDEVTELDLKVREQLTALRTLDQHAKETLKRVLTREGKNPNTVR